MLNVVLVEPEIPANTGNVGRTCVIAGARLHLVAPGFDLSDRAVRRAGLAYWQSLDVRVYGSWDEFVARNPPVRDALVGAAGNKVGTAPGAPCPGGRQTLGVHLLTKAGARRYTDVTFADGDWLVFGRESTGLPAELIAAHPGLCLRIPMRSDDALANAAAWHEGHAGLHPELARDICGNYVDPRAGSVMSLNLSNAVALVLYEALRQTGFAGLE